MVEADRPALIRLFTDPGAPEYLGGAVGFTTPQALELTPLGLAWGRWSITLPETDQMIGSISLDYDRGEPQLVYALLSEHVGRGYAGEACRAVLTWAAEQLEDRTVIAVTPARNKRSVTLLRRLGFTTRRGLEEFGTQQLLMERSLDEPLPEPVGADARPRD